jgi:hypothetical protein
MRTRARARIGGAAAHNDRTCVGDRPSAVRRGARRAGGGAYRDQRRDGGRVPRADVRVEGRRRLERLRAENVRLGGGVKCSHALARMRACPRTHTSARACTHASARTWRTIALATRAYDNRRTGQGAAPCRQPTHTGTLVCMDEEPTRPRACVAQEPYLQMLPCIDLYISDRWVPSEAHTPDDAHKRARAEARARTRARVCSGGCARGRTAHA